MPLFHYKALNARGEMLDGQMEAASNVEVVQRLQEQGHLPVEAKLASEAGASSSWKGLFKPKAFTGARLVQFTQQLSTLLGAGQPLDRALTILLDLPEDEAAKSTVADIRDAVRGGTSLSVALERQHGTFSRLYINMVRAGEAGGNLHETLSRLDDYLERSRVMQGRVINALIYPAILLCMVGASLMFLLGYVVPQFGQMYESLDAELPMFTQVILWLGLFVRNWWIVLIAVPALAVLWFDRKRRDPAFREALDGWLLKRKFVGALIGKIETARLTRTLGTLVRNGVPLMTAIGIGRNVLNNRVLAADVDAAAEEVKNGVSLSTALSKGKRFPRLALQMIQVGEESGALDAMLMKTAETFEQDTGMALDRMLAALVPIVTVVLAGIVGTVVMAVLLPLYDLTNSIG
ncbi:MULTISPECIES: type II secretion system F family protein [Lysobacter]|jgi:general secretion pathway protein F|uniref:General secretion pathway protein F n=1 Tax=Lysobacter capsici AZ78 TaxID=1444315 RepID=A0A108UCK6_9GAMM|nr:MULTISPECIES: type II secretion system F family protein [Lysobacter]ATE73335.1 type II secretion system protein GspF [Lysobacter capsici]KRB11016.1 type II secretion system protein GspF [Lysobacter sp. Root690]KWS06642.1 General secretion pathway protein F [Lysobacter capsici AZ78]UOF13968.1 type II secretion system F family protein [Lysobacter capsici]WND79563.1 type II secretion system F family protein [Lysobacter capsici]